MNTTEMEFAFASSILNRSLLKSRSIRVLAFAAMIAGWFCAMPASAQQPSSAWAGPKMRIAVMDLSGSALKLQTTYQPTSTTSTIALPPPSEFARGLTEMLTTTLSATGKFVVLERAAIDKVTGEQDFGDSGRVNPETAPSKGKIIGAQSLITGDITEFTYEQSRLGGKFKPLAALDAKADVVTAKVVIDIRLIDAVTGEVVFSQRAKGKASMTGVAAEFVRGDQSFSGGASSNTPLGKASREALEQAVAAIVAGMKNMPWTGRVIDVREAGIYINAGSDVGMQPGLELEVYEQQESLVDPETGKKLGTPDRRIGSVVIESVQDKYSVARVTAGEGFKRNHLLRFKGQTAKP